MDICENGYCEEASEIDAEIHEDNEWVGMQLCERCWHDLGENMPVRETGKG